MKAWALKNKLGEYYCDKAYCFIKEIRLASFYKTKKQAGHIMDVHGKIHSKITRVEINDLTLTKA